MGHTVVLTTRNGTPAGKPHSGDIHHHKFNRKQTLVDLVHKQRKEGLHMCKPSMQQPPPGLSSSNHHQASAAVTTTKKPMTKDRTHHVWLRGVSAQNAELHKLFENLDTFWSNYLNQLSCSLRKQCQKAIDWLFYGIKAARLTWQLFTWRYTWLTGASYRYNDRQRWGKTAWNVIAYVLFHKRRNAAAIDKLQLSTGWQGLHGLCEAAMVLYYFCLI